MSEKPKTTEKPKVTKRSQTPIKIVSKKKIKASLKPIKEENEQFLEWNMCLSDDEDDECALVNITFNMCKC